MTMSVEDVAKNEERKKMRQRQYDQIHKRRSTPEVGAVSILFNTVFLGINLRAKSFTYFFDGRFPSRNK